MSLGMTVVFWFWNEWIKFLVCRTSEHQGGRKKYDTERPDLRKNIKMKTSFVSSFLPDHTVLGNTHWTGDVQADAV